MFAIYSIPILGMIFMGEHGQSKMYKARHHKNGILPFGTTWTGIFSSKLMDTMWKVKVVKS